LTALQTAASVRGKFANAKSPAKSMMAKIDDLEDAVKQVQGIVGLTADKRSMTAPTTGHLAIRVGQIHRRLEELARANDRAGEERPSRTPSRVEHEMETRIVEMERAAQGQNRAERELRARVVVLENQRVAMQKTIDDLLNAVMGKGPKRQ
jgi:hypothetical protein